MNWHTEIIDTVGEHLIRQGRKSQGPATRGPGSRCLLRNPKGLTCAVGCLIPDALYEGWMENTTIDELLWRASLRDHFTKRFNVPEGCWPDAVDLLCKLQEMHDHMEPGEWPQVIEEIGDE